MSKITNPNIIRQLKKAFANLSETERWEHILEIMPQASLETDNYGQYVIYTDCFDPNHVDDNDDD